MPVYEYECPGCGHVEEVWHPATTEPDTIIRILRCPKCGENGPPLRRIISRANFTLKGRGWAKDGYK